MYRKKGSTRLFQALTGGLRMHPPVDKGNYSSYLSPGSRVLLSLEGEISYIDLILKEITIIIIKS